MTKPSGAAQLAVGYITVGALVLVWSGVWFAWLLLEPGSTTGRFYVCTGTMLSGFVLLCIGLLLGRIGRAAKPADHPPEPAVQTTTDAAGNVTTAAPATAPVPAQPVATAPQPAVVNPPAAQPNGPFAVQGRR